jgi:adenosylcobinamide-GDP ribazoletransferase
MDVLLALVIAFSFFTIIPMPMIDWTSSRMKFVPLYLPVVGLAVGFGGWGLFLLLSGFRVAVEMKAVVMVLYYLMITGGIHMDGLMDTADAYFSRREIARKLEIMKDSRVGAFAVMAIAAILLLKLGLFSEVFSKVSFHPLILIFIPVLSRSFQSSMIYLFPYAKGEGLAAMYGKEPDKKFLIMFGLVIVIACVGIYALAGFKYLAVPGVCVLYYVFYYFSSKKQFGGITGDVLGAYLELSELVMLAAAVLM